MDQVIPVVESRKGVKFLKVAAEQLMDLAEQYGVSMVPAFVFFVNGSKVELFEGADVAKLKGLVEKYASSEVTPADGPSVEGGSLEDRLRKLTQSAHVMLFMKGNPAEPKCKFSRGMIEILNEEQIKFASFDVLQDPAVREGLKTFANWKTFPQLWIGGKLVGGLDSVKELTAAGKGKDLKSLISSEAAAIQSLNAAVAARAARASQASASGLVVVDDSALQALISSAPVMIFMKGSPDEPQCGFSSRMVQLLRSHGIEFSSFDILRNEEVRQKLKKFSNWPTYPQLYVNSKLVGGLDIVQEIAEEAEDLAEELGIEKLESKVKKLVLQAPNMLFMKGSPTEPRCGFSREMVRILKENNIPFDSFDILTDETLRQGLKDFAKWPTYPMLFNNGTLVGGLDVVKELAEEGELLDSVAMSGEANKTSAM